jgi:hypothetical protein
MYIELTMLSAEWYFIGTLAGLLAFAIAAVLSRSPSSIARFIKITIYLLASLWYVILTKLIVGRGVIWPAIIGYEVQGYWPVGIPYGNTILVIAWYSLSLLTVIFVKSIKWSKRA